MLQEGIDAALPGDTLVVKGTCLGASTISKTLALKGFSNKPFGVATLDGDDLGAVLTIEGAVSVEISGLVITGGLPTIVGAGAGGIHNAGPGTVTLVDATVRGNFGLFAGGGIYNGAGGTVEITSSTVAGNGVLGVSSIAGGVFNAGTLTIQRSTVTQNVSQGTGGGVVNWGGRLTITASELSHNRSWFGGGLVNDFGGIATVADTEILENIASQGGLDGDGGGILNEGSALTLTSSKVSGNRARAGGGIFNSGAVTLVDSTVTANSASEVGGGVYNLAVVTLSGTTVIAANTPDNCYPPGSITGCT